MIHYHGTPTGGTRAGSAQFIAGRHVLIPFPRPEDIGTAGECAASFCIDNGAFTVWKSGGKLDVPSYIKFCEQWHRHPAFDWALIPDVIEGSEEDNDALLGDWPENIEGVPVWHLHESLDRLERLSHEYRTVAMGSSGEWPNPGAERWWNRMSRAMDVLIDEQKSPRCRLHGLRMLSPQIFTRIPFASCDSTNAVRNANLVERFGMYPPPTSAARMSTIADRIEAYQSPAIWVSRQHQAVLDFMEPKGLFSDSD